MCVCNLQPIKTAAETDAAIREVSNAVNKELDRALTLYGPMINKHQGYAIILEELDELWEEVKAKKCSSERMREECVQIAAMAMRFVVDLT